MKELEASLKVESDKATKFLQDIEDLKVCSLYMHEVEGVEGGTGGMIDISPTHCLITYTNKSP